MADLDKFIIEVAALPLDDDRGEGPAEISAKALIGEAVAIEFQSTQEPIWLIDRGFVVDYGIKSDLVCH
jgi:hypothetical protein